MKLTPWMLTVAAFGILTLLAAGFFLKKLFAAPVVEVKTPEPRILPMAVSVIEPGTVVTRAHLGNGRAAANEELSEDTFLSLDSIVGRIAKERIEAAIPLRGSMFYAIGDQPDLDIAEGKRAVTVRVSEETVALARHLKAGQFVDVHLTILGVGTQDEVPLSFAADEERSPDYGDSMTFTLFKGIKIVDIQRDSPTVALSGNATGNITLELDEDQARLIVLAQRKGSIDLTYNHLGPDAGGIQIDPAKENRITMREILGITPVKANRPFRSEQYRGGAPTIRYYRDGESADPGGSGNRTVIQPGTPVTPPAPSSGGFLSTDTSPAIPDNKLTESRTTQTAGL